MPIDRHDPAICGVCARMAVGYGYADPGKSQIIWVCDDPQCLKTARASYNMKQEIFDRIESLAAGKGGDAGIAYLEEIGKMAIDQLVFDEWCEFRRRIIAGYRVALSKELANEAPF